LRFLGLRDKTLDYYDPQDLSARILPVMHELRPSVIITFHEVIGGHADHCAIGRAARLAWERSDRTARLYYLLWTGDQELVRRAGSTSDRVTAVTIKGPAAVAKMRAFRAHRTQSELMDWLRSDKTALKRLSGREYFLQGSGPVRPGESDLLP
jgi:N-acetylglucosamine malate deacetylase 2